jgi:NifU-like protein involved in Fe-S cluster formation
MPRFSQRLLEHARSPQNTGALELPSVHGTADLGGQAPRICVYVRSTNQLISAASFTTFGCGVMIACGSVLTGAVLGRTIAEAYSLKSEDVVNLLDRVPQDKLFCVDLAIEALRRALDKLVA